VKKKSQADKKKTWQPTSLPKNLKIVWKSLGQVELSKEQQQLFIKYTEMR
jgi:hypothetical protein